jgi:very-short-patch-repair endonuclease
MSPHNPSPLAGEGGARVLSEAKGVGGRGGVPSYSDLLERAKHMRANPTDAERRLWSILRGKRLAGFKFRRQVVIDSYIADFVNFDHRLIVEADGSQHADNRYDERRDAYLEREGFTVLRFWNSDALRDSSAVAETIWHALQSPPLPSAASRLPPSPARGEGQLSCSSPPAGEDSEACPHGGLAKLGEGGGTATSSIPHTGARHARH